jgi:hypothetical protein
VNIIKPRLDILPAAQQALWPILSKIEPGFVLYGGTAIALYYGHRESVDFDFFGDPGFDPDAFKQKYDFLKKGKTIQIAPNTLSVIAETPKGEVKFSFFGGLQFGRAATPSVCNDTLVRLASPLDLTVQKLKVILARSEAKDYLDLDCLLRNGIDLADALGAATAIYPDMSTALSLRAMCYFDDGDVASIPPAAKARLKKAVRDVTDPTKRERESSQIDIPLAVLEELKRARVVEVTATEVAIPARKARSANVAATSGLRTEKSRKRAR